MANEGAVAAEPKKPMSAIELAEDVLKGAGDPGGEDGGNASPGIDDHEEGDGEEGDEEGAATDQGGQGAGAIQEDEDDGKFLELNKGKQIPYEVFAKKNEKWKGRLTAAEAKFKADMDAAVKKAQDGSQKYTPEQVARYKNLDGVFGNIDKAIERMPFLGPALIALGQGKQPDLRTMQEALAKHLENSPTVPAEIAQQLSALSEWRGQVEYEREVANWNQSRDTQIAQIKETFKDFEPEITEKIVSMSKRIAAGLAANLPDNAPAEAYPKLNEIAADLGAILNRGIEADRKKQISGQRKVIPAGPATPAAPSGAAKRSMPPAGTPEFFTWLQDPDNLAWMEGRTAS